MPSRTSALTALAALALIATGCGQTSASGPSPPPELLMVTSVAPDVGPLEGRVAIRISGTGFQPGATVRLDTSAATNVSVSGSTTIWATPPPHAEGTVDLVVTNPDGQTVRLAGAYTYALAAVTSVSPSSGTIGKWIRIFGFGFLGDSTVTFDGTASTKVIFESTTSMFALAPAHAPGAADVAVSTAGGRVATLRAAFAYHPVTLTVTPTEVEAGNPLSVSWVAPAGQSAWDWIGLFKIGDSNIRYVWYQYTGTTSGRFTVPAPMQAGQYEFRYMVDDEYNEAARSAAVTVTSAASRRTANFRTQDRRLAAFSRSTSRVPAPDLCERREAGPITLRRGKRRAGGRRNMRRRSGKRQEPPLRDGRRTPN